MLSRMSFNVKPVRDEDKKLTREERMVKTQDNIDAAQAYSEIAQNLVTGVTTTIVAGACTIIIAKGSFDVLKALAVSFGTKK
jgi:hypothetical protein